MVRRKVRRESGRQYTKFYDPENGYFFQQYWDDWLDYRDGFRSTYSDNTKLQPKQIHKERWCNGDFHKVSVNKKIRMLLNRRKARKVKNNEKR